MQQGLRVGVHAQHAQLLIHQPLRAAPPLASLQQGRHTLQCRQARMHFARSTASPLRLHPPLGQPQWWAIDAHSEPRTVSALPTQPLLLQQLASGALPDHHPQCK